MKITIFKSKFEFKIFQDVMSKQTRAKKTQANRTMPHSTFLSGTVRLDWILQSGQYSFGVYVMVSMLSVQDARVARRVKKRLSEITNVKRVVVYGSRARGTATKDSDLDLYIELNASVDPSLRRKIREIAWEVSLDSGIVISTLVDSDRLRGQPILKVIEADGIAI